MGFAFNVLTTVGTVAAVWQFEARERIRILAVVAIALLALLVLTVETRAFLRLKPRRMKSDRRIRRFMYDWIKSEGRVVIFSRDLSWVEQADQPSIWGRMRRRPLPAESRIRLLLRRKAAAQELVVCVPNGIPLTKALAAEGADIRTYSDLEVVPSSRFTLVRHGRVDTALAIGRRVGNVQEIEVISVGEHPAFGLAEDLVAFVTAIDERRL